MLDHSEQSYFPTTLYILINKQINKKKRGKHLLNSTNLRNVKKNYKGNKIKSFLNNWRFASLAKVVIIIIKQINCYGRQRLTFATMGAMKIKRINKDENNQRRYLRGYEESKPPKEEKEKIINIMIEEGLQKIIRHFQSRVSNPSTSIMPISRQQTLLPNIQRQINMSKVALRIPSAK